MRSIQPPDEQNAPVLSALNDCTTSGALPPRIAAMILSSLMPPTVLTLMSGVRASKSSTACLITPSSRAVKPTQSVMFAGFAAPPTPLLGRCRDWLDRRRLRRRRTAASASTAATPPRRRRDVRIGDPHVWLVTLTSATVFLCDGRVKVERVARFR